MAKVKKPVVENYEDIFADLQASQKEVEQLVAQAKAMEVEEVKQEVQQAPAVKELSYAYGVHKNKETNRWEVVEIIYNSEDSTARVHDTIMSTNSKPVAQVRGQEFLARRLLGLPIPRKNAGK
jgi:hypothetical protein